MRSPTLSTTPCKYCTTPTAMLGTRMCHRCWELRTRLAEIPGHVLSVIIRDLGSEERRVICKVLESLRDAEEHF